MQTVKAFRGNARTFLTHMFGRGLDDDRYVIERFRSKAEGEIHPRRRNGASKKSRGKTSREIVSLSTVQKMTAQARRDHRLHRHRHHRWNSILGRSRDGLAGERQVSLRFDPSRRPAGFRRPDALHQDHHCGRKEHALQRIPKRNAHAPGGAMNALPPSGPPAACVLDAARRSQCPIVQLVPVPAARSGARLNAHGAMRRPGPLVCCTPAEMPNGAAGARVTGASGATGHGGTLACARVAAQQPAR